MNGNKQVMIMTIVSLLSFCLLIIAVFNSGLGELEILEGRFNSKSMWLAIGILILSYAIPLSLYAYRFDWLKYIIMIFNYISIFISLFLIGFIITTGYLNSNLSENMGIIAICVMNVVLNIGWIGTMYFTKRQQHTTEVSI